MDDKEYGKLIDFLGRKFDRIDDRFEDMDRRFEEIDEKIEDAKRYTGILIEEVNHRIDLVIEGQQGIIQKLDGHIKENESEHGRLEHMIMEDRADIYNMKKRSK